MKTKIKLTKLSFNPDNYKYIKGGETRTGYIEETPIIDKPFIIYDCEETNGKTFITSPVKSASAREEVENNEKIWIVRFLTHNSSYEYKEIK